MAGCTDDFTVALAARQSFRERELQFLHLYEELAGRRASRYFNKRRAIFHQRSVAVEDFIDHSGDLPCISSHIALSNFVIIDFSEHLPAEIDVMLFELQD